MRVIEMIARGGFGVVEKVLLDDGSICARKRYSPRLEEPLTDAEHEKLVRRFHREIRTQQAMDGAYVCPVLDCDFDDQAPWYLMPLAHENFQALIERFRNREEDVTSAIADILNAVEEIHRLGYVHRDLKPQNILRLEGRWVLTDLGLVLPPSGRTVTITGENSAWGTRQYMAPEQMDDFHRVTATADIYAIGCVLHDLYGEGVRIPFACHSAPGPIGWVIEKCTEARSDRRFPSIQALRGALMRMLGEASAPATSKDAEKWVLALLQSSIDSEEELRGLVRYVSSTAEAGGRWAVLRAVDEEELRRFHDLDQVLWARLADELCEWARLQAFQFEFCDVLIGRLEVVFELGDLALQAASVIAAASLASSHNRWFVMRRVLRICGSGMSEVLARRLQVEIVALQCGPAFVTCAREVGRDIDAYHPLVQAALTISAT